MKTALKGNTKANQLIKLHTSFAKSEKMEADEDGFIYIEGFASTDDIDRHGDVIPADVWNRNALKNFRKNPVVLYNHNRSKVIGKVVSMEKQDKGLFVKCAIDAEDEIGRKIAMGLLKTFSIGFYLLDFDYNDEIEAWVIKSLELLEISVVSIPANQDATFDLSKQLGGQENVKQLRQKLLGNNQQENMKDTGLWKKWFGNATEEQVEENFEKIAQEKTDLENQVQTLETEKSDLANELQETKTSNENLTQEIETLKAEKETLTQELEQLKTAATDTEKSVKDLETEVANLKAKLAKAKGIKRIAVDGQDPDVSGHSKKEKKTPNADKALTNSKALNL